MDFQIISKEKVIMNTLRTIGITTTDNITMKNYKLIDYEDFIDTLTLLKLKEEHPYHPKYIKDAQNILKALGTNLKYCAFYVKDKFDEPLVIITDIEANDLTEEKIVILIAPIIR